MSSVSSVNSELNNEEVQLVFTTLQQIDDVIKENADSTVEVLMEKLTLKKIDYKAIFNNDFQSITTHKLFLSYQQMETPFWDFVKIFLTKYKNNLKDDISDMFKNEMTKYILNTLEIKKLKETTIKTIRKTNAVKIPLSSIYPSKECEVKLRIQCTPMMFKNLTITEKPRNLLFSEKIAQEWSHPLLQMKTLINWNDVGFKLNLPGIEYVHYVNNKYKRLLYLSNTKREEIKIKENDLDVYITGNIENQSFKLVNAELTTVYLQLIRKAVLEVPGFTDRRKNEIIIVLDAILQDLKTIKAPNLYIGMECVYVRNKYNYYRVRDVGLEEDKPATYSSDLEKGTIIWETVTPQIRFILKRCFLDNDDVASPIMELTQYFTKLFEQDSYAVKQFQCVMKKCIIYQCLLCMSQFEGVLGSYGLQEHIERIHGSEQNWICENCQKSFDPCQLSSNGWEHIC